MISTIVDALNEALDGVKVECRQDVANNGVILNKLSFDNGSNISPCITINRIISDIEAGEIGINEAIFTIIDTYYEASKRCNFDISRLSDREYILKNVFPLLVSSDNKDFLRNKITKNFLDMSVFYKVIIDESDNKRETFAVTEDFIEDLGISVDELHAAALNNIKEDYKISSLTEFVIRCMMEETGLPYDELVEMFSVDDNIDNPLYILTNGDSTYGSNLILIPEILEKAANKIGSSKIYIIPSSIHETLIMDAKQDLTPEEILEMVKSINAEHVVPQDKLTDNVYLYDNETKEIVPFA